MATKELVYLYRVLKEQSSAPDVWIVSKQNGASEVRRRGEELKRACFVINTVAHPAF